jgi:branched-chain amino acid transport system permease protein
MNDEVVKGHPLNQNRTGNLNKSVWIISFLVLSATLILPFIVSGFVLDVMNRTLLSFIAAIALNILTGYAGQVSLGHAGFLAAGAFTTAIVNREMGIPFIPTLIISTSVGMILGLFVGLPSLRLKGLYLALGTLGIHYIIVYLGGEYQFRWNYNTGIIIDNPKLGPILLDNGIKWFYFLAAFSLVVWVYCQNLTRTRTGRAWMALRDRDIAAASMGVNVAAYKLRAFVFSSGLTSLAGSLGAFYIHFVSVDAFTFYLTIEYIAMVIIGGLGSILGSFLGAFFVTVLPHVIDDLVDLLGTSGRIASHIFAVKFSFFGLLMVIFLIFEPQGILGIWNRLYHRFKNRP